MEYHPNVLENEMLKRQFDVLFTAWNQRKGARDDQTLHLSTLIQPFFCERQQVLAHFYTQAVPDHAARLCAIFLEGWTIHERIQAQISTPFSQEEQERILQELFRKEAEMEGEAQEFSLKEKYRLLIEKIAPMAFECEKTHYAPLWDVGFTPDAVIKVLLLSRAEVPAVLEIKGYNHAAFQKILQNPMAHSEYRKAVIQANNYIHLLRQTGAYPEMQHSVILLEDKDNQQFMTHLHPYRPEEVPFYEERAKLRLRYLEAHREHGLLPLRVCETPESEHAVSCPSKDACFASWKKRVRMSKPESRSEPKVEKYEKP